jgi:hypothetical protein
MVISAQSSEVGGVELAPELLALWKRAVALRGWIVREQQVSFVRSFVTLCARRKNNFERLFRFCSMCAICNKRPLVPMEGIYR